MGPLRRAWRLACVVALTAASAFAEGPQDVARRFFALAYDGQFDRLPKSASAHTERFERQARNILRVRCVRIERITITADAGDAMNVDLLLDKRERQDARGWASVDAASFRVILVRAGERWLVDDVRDRDEELAAQLLRVNGEERERLLFEQRARISKALARALHASALAFLNSGKFAEAGNALAMARRIAVEAGDRGGEALAVAATIYTGPDDPRFRERAAEETMTLAEGVREPDVLARVWYDRGRRYGAARDAVAVRAECFRQAVAFGERAEDPTTLSRALYSLANLVANAQNDYLTARRLIDRGLALSREIGDRNGEMGFTIVLATVYFDQGDRERGMFHHTRALELAEELHAYAYPLLLIRSGHELLEDGQYEKARAAFARVLIRNETGVTSRVGSMTKNYFGVALSDLSRIEAESGNLAEAECLMRESSQYLGDPNIFQFELAPYYARKGDAAAALAHSLTSLAEKGLYDPDRVTALVYAGRAYRALGDAERGLRAALDAIEIREAIDTRVAGDAQQRVFAAGMLYDCYELAAELALDRGDPVQALGFLEQGRARVLTDIFDNGRPGVMQADALEQERQSALDRDVARLTAALDRARSNGDARAAAAAGRQLTRVRDERASFLDGLQARSARQRAIRRRAGAGTILELAARLPPRTAGVEYFVGDHELHIFVIARDASGKPRVASRVAPVGRKELEASVHTWLEMLAGGDLRVDTAAAAVYRSLIAPIERDLAGAGALIVVPDEILWRVPFAALADARGRYLVERSAIVYAPSMTAYSTIVGSTRKRRRAPLALLAIGNPTADPGAAKAAASFYRDAKLGPLPDAEHEVDALRRLYDPRHSLVLKRGQATEARTKASLADAEVAHFATHAILDDANPMYSRLMLARDGAAAEDGWLESWEVARLDLNADLVVLSACETGRGRVGGGEGVIGLTWSFFLAGARSTVATQWNVASDSTAELMIAFHRFLRQSAGEPALHKAQSLRKAQLQLLRGARTRHPFHWAPFVLLGDPSSVR